MNRMLHLTKRVPNRFEPTSFATFDTLEVRRENEDLLIVSMNPIGVGYQ